MGQLILCLVIVFGLQMIPTQSEAGWLFHATKKAAARKIMVRGFSKKMNPKARFGKGYYFSKSPTTALKEKPGANAIVVTRGSKMLTKNALSTKHWSTAKLKKFSGDRDLRGKIHKGVIGPKLGKEIGRKAGRQRRPVLYRSARDRNGSNLFIPPSVYQKHPRIVRPQKVVSYGR
ncbi:MAG: hypothetical protein HY879_22635 [Deltaproteobacteria bacterium]|nr:hypothetical protein [Deltaproteobacteria bacterium]